MRRQALPSRRRALLLAPESPYPRVGGGPLRTASLAEYLASRYALDAIVFRQPGQPDPAPEMPAGLLQRLDTLWLPAHRRDPLARAGRNLGRAWRGVPPLVDRFAGHEGALAGLLAGRQYDVIVVEHLWCAPYAALLRRHTRRLLLDLHNIESVLHARSRRGAPLPAQLLHRRFAACASRVERRFLPAFDDVLVTSPEDAALARSLSAQTRTIVYPNALPVPALPAGSRAHAVVFSGNLEYQPNVTAVQYFRRGIWPQLKLSWPALRWRLIGMNSHAVRRLVDSDDRIDLVGPVEDAVQALAEAQVAVCPLLAGSGTRFKILEAWAAAVPVVSTTLGAEGLGAVSGEELFLADEPEAFAQAVSHLLALPAARQKLGMAGRRCLEERFSWEAVWHRLDEAGL